MKLLVVVTPTIASEDVRDALVERAAAGPVQVALVAAASDGTDAARDQRMAQYVDRVVTQLRAAGISVRGVAGDRSCAPAAGDAWDPDDVDEIVLSLRPWLSCRAPGSEPGAATP